MSADADFQVNPAVRADNLAVALDLAARGFRVFPIRDWGDGAGWKPIKSFPSKASAHAQTLAAWWRDWPDARVGLLCGPENGISVLDVDEKHGYSGSATLDTLGFPDVESISPVRVRTPSGGWHLFFKHDKRLYNGIGDRGRGIGKALDIRTSRAFVLAPGSFKDGKRYEPVGEALGAVDLPDWPEALIPAAKPEYEHAAPVIDATEAQRTWARLHLSGLANDLAMTLEGGRNDAANSAAMWAGGAGAHGFLNRKEAQAALVAAALACGLDEREAESAFEHGWVDGQRQPISGFPPAIDGNALLDEEPDDADDISGDEVPRAAKRSFGIQSIEEATSGNGREYLVKGFLARGDFACIFGQPGAGKSLIAPYLAYCVATGAPAFGMRVKQGAAWYVAAEDAHGLAWRAMALQRRYGVAAEFRLVNELTAPQAAISEEWKAFRQAVKDKGPALIVIDTLAMAYPGIDENKAESMGAVVARCRGLTRWGAAVVLIHHAPKAGDTPRGHSLLNGALDVALHLEPKDGDGIVRGRLTKNRNGSVDREFAFKIGIETMGIDSDGDVITFALCEPLEGPEAFKRKSLGPKEAVALELARSLRAADRSIDGKTWQERCIATGTMADSTDPKAHANGWRRIRDKLIASRHLVENDGKLFVAVWVLAERENSTDADEDLIG